MSDSKSVFLAIITANCEEKLNIFLKCIEDLDYDKKSICIYINTNNNRDNTVQILLNWIEKNHLNYKNIIFEYKDDPRLTSDVVSWEDSLGARLDVMGKIRQRSIDLCIIEESDYYFCVDTDNWIRPCTLKHLIEKDKPIVAPLLHSFSEENTYSNYFAGIRANGFYPESNEPIFVMNSCNVPTKIPSDETYSTITHEEFDCLHFLIWQRQLLQGTFEVPLVHCCYLIQKKYLKEIQYISPTRYLNGCANYEFVTFSNFARLNKVSQWICNEELFGWVRYKIGDDLEGKINLHLLKKEIDLKAEEAQIEETKIEESESLKNTKELIKKLTQQSKQTATDVNLHNKRNLIISPQAGFGNRMRALCSAIHLSELSKRNPWVCYTNKTDASDSTIEKNWFLSLPNLLPEATTETLPKVDKIFSEWTEGYWYPKQSDGQRKWLSVDSRIPIIGWGDSVETILSAKEETILIETSIESNFLKVMSEEQFKIKKAQIYQKYFIPNSKYMDALAKIESVDVVIHIRTGDLLWYFPESRQNIKNIEKWIVNEFKNTSKRIVIFSNDIDTKLSLISSLQEQGILAQEIRWEGIENTAIPFMEFLFMATKCDYLWGTPKSSFSEEAGAFRGKFHYSPIPVKAEVNNDVFHSALDKILS